jgi:UDP-2,3-diacylglucosamine pyrophosphatase LpxH
VKYLVISDLHLSEKFELKKFNTLKKLVEEHDKVIIVGDFWDAWKVNFDDFINSEWSKLFPVLKKKKAIYVFGNHDPKLLCNDRVEEFSDISDEAVELEIGKESYTFMHGDKISRRRLSGYKKKYFGVVNINNKSLLSRILRTILNFLSNFVPAVIMESSGAGLFLNREIKNQHSNSSFIVCGDSHSPELDIENKFINSGFWGRNIYSYVTIDETGPKLFIEKYK